MAELLVRIVDKVNTDDFYRNCQCTKRGDVIAAQPDGWPWGREELATPDWRILSVPDMTVSEASVFLSAERDVDPRHPSRTLQRRAFKINLDHQDLVGVGGPRSGHVPLSSSIVLAAKQVRPPIADPTVFGSSPNVF